MQSLEHKFKKGDKIVFLKDIKAGRERNNILLVPAYHPCTIISINSAHVTIEFEGIIEKLRYIPKRMAPAGDLAKAIYG